MQIIFGWREFIIEKYTSTVIGIDETVLPKTQIRLAQEYFHLFFIPFFGTDKMWYYHSNGKWLVLKPEHEAQILPKFNNKFTPWYQYAGILLLLLIGFGYYIFGLASAIKSVNDEETHLQITKSKYNTQINHLNENFYIGLENRTNGSIEGILYLKIDSIIDQKLYCSLINPNKSYDITPFYIDSLYNNHKSELDTISITKQLLLQAIPIKNGEQYTTSASGISVYDKRYSVIELFEHSKPYLSKGNKSSFNTDGNFMISFKNQLDGGQIIGIENSKTTKLNWITKFPIAIPIGCSTQDKNDRNSIFELNGTNYNAEQPFEFILKCLTKQNKKINYLVKGTASDFQIEEIY